MYNLSTDQQYITSLLQLTFFLISQAMKFIVLVGRLKAIKLHYA